MSIDNRLILAVVYRKGGLGPTGQPVDFGTTRLDDVQIEKMLERGTLGLRWLLAGLDSEEAAMPCQLDKGRMVKPVPLESD